MDIWKKILSECSDVFHEAPFSFAAHSAIGCGGAARAAFYPPDSDRLLFLVDKFRREGVPFVVLGNLSDVLPSDGGYDGAVILTTRMRETVFGDTAFAQAGVTAKAFLDECVRRGKTGAEFLAGIPCTIGGATFMNAGAGGKYIADILESALVYREGKIRTVPKEECGFSYKRSAFMQDGSVILGASFRLEDADGKAAEGKIAEALRARRGQPKGRTMGCVFKNPPGDFAGRLIDRAGLKGLRVGGAVISEEHANFIVNVKGATSADVRALINLAKNAVFAQYGVELEEEIRYIP